MFSSRNTIILLLFAILYIHAIFALNCYQCNSIINPECENNENIKNFTHVCDRSDNIYSKNVFQDESLFRANHAISYTENKEWRCAKVVGHNATLSETRRYCISKSRSLGYCKAFEEEIKEESNAVVDHCSFCDSDLCNSS